MNIFFYNFFILFFYVYIMIFFFWNDSLGVEYSNYEVIVLVKFLKWCCIVRYRDMVVYSCGGFYCKFCDGFVEYYYK